MVMFHPEIPYAEAQRRGAIQARILEELDAGEAGEPDLSARGGADPRAAVRLIRSSVGIYKSHLAALANSEFGSLNAQLGHSQSE